MKQITVVVDDEVGKLADISFILGKSKINIDSISLAKIGQKNIINLALKNDERALAVLEANGYSCLRADILVAKLPNKPGELAKMSKLLSDNKINIESINAITQDDDYSIYSIKVDKYSKAEKVLEEYLKVD